MAGENDEDVQADLFSQLSDVEAVRLLLADMLVGNHYRKNQIQPATRLPPGFGDH